MIIATAGHVDHGKTSLVRALTGVDTDRLPEEKRRGLTIDLGFAYTDLVNGGRLGFVDVPGHHRFIANMVAGVAGVDAALVVVAADDGVMPQTEEHVAILDLLGIDRGVIAVTKTDKVDAARLGEVEASIRRLVEGSTLLGLSLVRTSTETGAGIDDLKKILTDVRIGGRVSGQRFRLAIDRSFVIDGVGAILAGPVLSGGVAVGEELVVMPAGIPVSARGLRVQDSEAISAEISDRCAIQIGGRNAGRDVAGRGDWLCARDTGIASRRLDVRIRSARTRSVDIRHDVPVHAHIGAADIPGRLVLLDRRRLAPGQEAWAQIILDREVCAVRGDRFVLRDQSARATIAGGWVVDPMGAERGRARPERLETLAALAQPAPEDALRGLLAISGGPVDAGDLARRWNLTQDAAREAWSRVALVRVGTLVFDPEYWAAWRHAAMKALENVHRDQPDRLGLDIASLAAMLRLRQPEARLLLAELIADGAVVSDFGIYRLPDHQPRLTPVDQAAWEALRPLLGDAGRPAEVAHQIAKNMEGEALELLSLLGRMEGRGLVIRVSRNRYLLPETVSRLATAAETASAAHPDGITIAGFREHAEVGRNLAVEFLEFLDRRRMTKRLGVHRILLASAAEIFGI